MFFTFVFLEWGSFLEVGSNCTVLLISRTVKNCELKVLLCFLVSVC